MLEEPNFPTWCTGGQARIFDCPLRRLRSVDRTAHEHSGSLPTNLSSSKCGSEYGRNVACWTMPEKHWGCSHSCYPTCYPTFITPWIASPDSHMKISTKNCQGQLCDLCKIREATPLFWVALSPWDTGNERSPVLFVKQTQFGQNLGKEIREICDGHLYFWRHLLEMKTLGKKVRVR